MGVVGEGSLVIRLTAIVTTKLITRATRPRLMPPISTCKK